MLKELFLAIILGALLGFGITGGYLALDKKNNSNKNPPVVTSPTPISNEDNSKIIEETKDDNLSFDSLEDNDIVSKEDLEITGITSPDSFILASLNEKTFDTKSDKNGKFNLSVKLESGLNIIKITVIDTVNQQIEKTLNITYSTAKI